MKQRYAIFDLDGTLIDSMPAWKSLGRNYLAGKGVSIPDKLNETLLTMTLRESAAYFIKQFSLPLTCDEAIAEMHGMIEGQYQNTLEPKEGAAEYLQMLHAQGVRMCVATATSEPLADACLTRLGLRSYFEFILSCETLGTSKNRPDVFLLAAERMGASPDKIAVYEDALYAVQTAKQAGFYTVGVYDPSSHTSREKLTQLCNRYISDYWEELQHETDH